MKKNFEKELNKRLEENRRLSEKQFLPRRAFGLASWLVENMFYILLVLSFILAIVMVKVR